MGELIEKRFHERGTWPWAMGQVQLGYTVQRPGGPVIPPDDNWAISAQDALATDWEIVPEIARQSV